MIPNDPRTLFYSEATNFTILYACSIGLLGGQYSHLFKAVKVQELVRFDGVVVYVMEHLVGVMMLSTKDG